MRRRRPLSCTVAPVVEATATGEHQRHRDRTKTETRSGVSAFPSSATYKEPVVGSADTSVDGSYQIGGLSAGVYYVLFRGDGVHLREWYDNADTALGEREWQWPPVRW